MRDATLCIPVRENHSEILLGMKKRGFGQGRYNGFGGKPKPGESIEEAAIRELQEEAGISVTKEALQKMAELTFIFPTVPDKKWDQVVHVFLVNKWEGEPAETEEMQPKWFPVKQIPFELMWPDDSYWLPLVLSKKELRATFVFGEDQKTIIEKRITEKRITKKKEKCL